jgi:hypothetical protein
VTEGGDGVEVDQISLERIFDEYAPDTGVDFLKIDVEGWEARVLESASWTRTRPKVIVVEAVDPGGIPTHEEWEPRLLAAGYRLALFDGLNRFYCREESSELLALLSVPANVRDNWRHYRELRAQDALEERVAAAEAAARIQNVEAGSHESIAAAEAELAAERARAGAVIAAAETAARREREANERAVAALEEAQRAACGERERADRVAAELESVRRSTSWRVTGLLRNISRFVKLLRRSAVG